MTQGDLAGRRKKEENRAGVRDSWSRLSRTRGGKSMARRRIVVGEMMMMYEKFLWCCSSYPMEVFFSIPGSLLQTPLSPFGFLNKGGLWVGTNHFDFFFHQQTRRRQEDSTIKDTKASKQTNINFTLSLSISLTASSRTRLNTVRQERERGGGVLLRSGACRRHPASP